MLHLRACAAAGNYLNGSLPGALSSWKRATFIAAFQNSISGCPSLCLPARGFDMLVAACQFLKYAGGRHSGHWGTGCLAQMLTRTSTCGAGSLPAAWGNLSSLASLFLYNNQLTGALFQESYCAL